MGHLRRNDRLLKRRDFLRVQRSGFRAKSQTVTLVARRAYRPELGHIGFTVSKAVGKAHTRNLIKRRLRHLARENRWSFVDRNLVVVAQPQAAAASFAELAKDFIQAARRISELLSHSKGTPR